MGLDNHGFRAKTIQNRTKEGADGSDGVITRINALTNYDRNSREKEGQKGEDIRSVDEGQDRFGPLFHDDFAKSEDSAQGSTGPLKEGGGVSGHIEGYPLDGRFKDMKIGLGMFDSD
jgi:hypothetical protein